MVVESGKYRPWLSQKMTANLQPGEYDMTCGLLTNPKGKLIVKGEATAGCGRKVMRC
ncbi:inactive ferrous ion transporter periplasmic protein EfeO [Escherichia coli]|uniref:Inactive ferrous ion transporter periplasmic protein EfeO n=1 Tax=Escherichia coli TaxID=562 RepID=A0A376ZW71_ECOLX|nr:inactive ferrous ion transporter periplasmic protein EfeO [Escherichia coli]